MIGLKPKSHISFVVDDHRIALDYQSNSTLVIELMTIDLSEYYGLILR